MPNVGLFNRTFFKFTIGFMAILLVAFLIVAAVSYYESIEQANKVELSADVQARDLEY